MKQCGQKSGASIHQSFKGQAFAAGGIFFSILSFWMTGCASKAPLENKLLLSPTEEKILGLQQEVKSQETQIAKLNELVRDLNKKLSHPRGEPPAMISKKDFRKTAQTIPVHKLRPETGSTVTPASASELFMEGETVADSSQEAMHFYFQGLQQISEKNFEEALQSLRNFVTQNPQHVYADRAQYLIADTHFQNRDYGLVVVATNLLEARYPYSMKLPESLLKRGLALLEMNQTDQARLTFQNLARRFPNDPMAEPAQKKLAELGRSIRVKQP